MDTQARSHYITNVRAITHTHAHTHYVHEHLTKSHTSCECSGYS